MYIPFKLWSITKLLFSVFSEWQPPSPYGVTRSLNYFIVSEKLTFSPFNESHSESSPTDDSDQYQYVKELRSLFLVYNSSCRGTHYILSLPTNFRNFKSNLYFVNHNHSMVSYRFTGKVPIHKIIAYEHYF